MSDGLKLLGAIVDNGSVGVLRDLNEHLFIENEVEVFRFLRSHYGRYGELPDITTVESQVGLRIPECVEVTDYYLNKVYDRQLFGVVREKFNSLKECLRRYDMAEAREVIDELKASTRIVHGTSDVRNIREAMQGAMALYDTAHETPGISGVPTAWLAYDSMVGGYQPADLITFVARPEVGKTYILLKQALAGWRLGYSVLIITMEMSVEQCGRRMLAIESGINPHNLRKGQLSTYAQRRVERYLHQLGGSNRLHIFAGGLKSRVSDADMLISEFRPDILFIDGVYLMRPDVRKSLTRMERIPEVFDEVKSLTLSKNIPILVTTQYNRQAGKKGKEGSLENIAYSDAISTHSSLIISIQPGETPYEKNRRVLSVIKGREGETGDFPINYSFRPMDFSEVELVRDEEGNIVGDANEAAQQAQTTEWMQA